jgi:UDPglucose 6-dehydrogenase
VIKSTVPVGTGDEVERIVRAARPDASFAVVSNPEFLREGAAIRDFKHPDRIVVGLDDARANEVMAELYRPLYLNAAPILYTRRHTAELIKYASNAFLATKVTFINEIADLCEKLGADVQEVARGMGLDNRIGSKFLHAGPGFGGSCFPKDALALIKTAQDKGAPLRIVEAVVDVNDARKAGLAAKVAAALGGSVEGKTIGVLGLTFKPNTDDMREAPSVALIQALQKMGAKIRAYDPAGMAQASKVLQGVDYCPGPYECAERVDAVVIVTEWEQFRALDFERLKTLVASPVLIDLRNVYKADEVTRQGFHYVGVGRAASPPSREGPRGEVEPRKATTVTQPDRKSTAKSRG